MVGDNYFDTQNAVTQKKKNDRIWKWKIIHCVRTTIQRKKSTQHYTMLKYNED